MAESGYEPEDFMGYPPLEDEEREPSPYDKAQRTLTQRKESLREQIKESHRPKKDIEEHDNVKIPKELKNEITLLKEELAKRNKENRAIAFAIGTLNETIEKIQKDLEELTKTVKDLKDDANMYYVQDEDEKLLNKSYDTNIDIDTITQDILYKLKDELPFITKNSSKSKNRFEFTKKDLFFSVILIFLILTNPFFIKFINLGNKESLTTEYIVKKGDYAVCHTKENKENKNFALKEDIKLKVEKDKDGKLWFIIGDYYCYKETLNKN